MTVAVHVVIPAHNEAALLPRLLHDLRAASGLEVVVAANACTDETVPVARAAGATVIEVPTASKIAAINAAADALGPGPIAFLDADVRLRADDLQELADRLQAHERAHVAGMRLEVEDSESSWAVRAYYRMWRRTAYRTSGLVGSGLYLLDDHARARLLPFPDVIADDLLVQSAYPADQRLCADDLVFTVAAPRTWRALLRRAVRISAGNAQLARTRPEATRHRAPSSARDLALVALRDPRELPAFAVYGVTYLLAKVWARGMLRSGRAVAWNADRTTRETTA